MWEIAGINGEQVKLKIHAIPWFSLIFLAFLLSGGENPWLRRRERVLPLRAPFSSFGYGENL